MYKVLDDTVKIWECINQNTGSNEFFNSEYASLWPSERATCAGPNYLLIPLFHGQFFLFQNLKNSFLEIFKYNIEKKYVSIIFWHRSRQKIFFRKIILGWKLPIYLKSTKRNYNFNVLGSTLKARVYSRLCLGFNPWGWNPMVNYWKQSWR